MPENCLSKSKVFDRRGPFHKMTAKRALLNKTKSHVFLQAHPGTVTTSVYKYEDAESIVNMNTQVDKIKEIMGDFMKQHPDGINVICYSQGKSAPFLRGFRPGPTQGLTRTSDCTMREAKTKTPISYAVFSNFRHF